MWHFIDDYTDEEINALTGVIRSVLVAIFVKYCGKGTPIRRPIYLWWLLIYYKIYPIARACRMVHGGAFKDNRYFLQRIGQWAVSFARYLSLRIDDGRFVSIKFDLTICIDVYRCLAIFIVGYR